MAQSRTYIVSFSPAERHAEGFVTDQTTGLEAADMETKINAKIKDLASALEQLQFPRKSLPLPTATPQTEV